MTNKPQFLKKSLSLSIQPYLSGLMENIVLMIMNNIITTCTYPKLPNIRTTKYTSGGTNKLSILHTI